MKLDAESLLVAPRDGEDLLVLPRNRRTSEPSDPPVATGAMSWLDWRVVTITSLGLIALASGAPVVLIVLLVATAGTLIGPRQALSALAVIVTVKYLNEGVYRFPPLTGVLAWFGLFLVALRVVPKLNASVLTVLVPIWLFVLVTSLLAPINSANVTVSLMKVMSFGIGASGVVATALILSQNDVHRMRVWLPSAVLSVALVSLATIPFPEVAERVYPGSFQGILTHPQSFGTFLAPLVTLLAARILFQRVRVLTVDGAGLMLAGLMMLWSGTRTAALAVVLGIALAAFLGVLRDRETRRQAMRVWGLGGALAMLALVAILSSAHLRDAVNEFALKRDTTTTIDEAFRSSRGAGIESQWQNFRQRPMTGHGFGIFPGGGFSTEVVTFLGLPISAPVEKGFLPTAVLEEVGVFGAAAFLALIVSLVRRAVQNGDQAWTAALLTCLFINLGEAVFFSVGGIGLFFWLWIGLAMRGAR